MWVCECVFLARHQITFVCKSAAFLQTFFCAAATRQPTVAVRGRERENGGKGTETDSCRNLFSLPLINMRLGSTDNVAALTIIQDGLQ